ncbi:MAG: alanine racemase [Flavobacteriaceae bacterium]|nr:MAG: alanine racemase [Flavobacteriaceae bacterium]
MKNNHVTSLKIDLNAVDFNLNYFKSKLKKNTKLLVVVKAFGYGSDAVSIAKHLQNKVDYFAVAYTDEGITLRSSGIKTPIVVLHPQVVNLELLVANQLEPNLYSHRILDAFLSLSKRKNLDEYPIHLKFNTGLNRLGFSLDDIPKIASKLKGNKTIKISSVFSHLGASEDKNEKTFSCNQIDKFKTITFDFKKAFGFIPTQHMCNTSGILNYPEAHFDMVRLGIGLYGFANEKSKTSELKNVVSLHSCVSQIHTIKKGESVGYNRGCIANRPMKTATIPIGHADGISRKLGKGMGFVSIKNQRAFIVGNVCMDMIMVDISDIDCNEGDAVIIFDNQKTVETFAKNSGTIPYEFLTAISQRIKREIL